MTSKPKLIGITILAITIGLYGVDLDGTLTPTDLTNEHIGKTITLDGIVLPGTQTLTNNGTTMTFITTDGTTDITVTYSENQPVNIQDDMPVTITGKYLPDHTIDAHRILSECPSKYQTENCTVTQ